ncbi:MAG: hypothetical protein ACOX5R_15890 [bacterium]|jgi:hypothetical protein
MKQVEKMIRNSLFITGIIVSLSFLMPNTSSAQYGMGYGMGGMGYGMGGMGYGMGGMGGAAGPGQIIVKYGEKIYDAVFGDLVDYKVYYLPMPADTVGVHYFDDGTHGDEVPYDGVPSNITINRDTYLGPFSIKYKNQLKSAVQMLDKMGAMDFYDINVASDNPDSRVASLDSAQEQMEDVLQGMRARLAQFEGYDDVTYVKAIDPSLFESLEGFGGVGTGFAQGGILPDLPPPPGMPEPSIRGPQQPGDEGIIDSAPELAPSPGEVSPPAQRFDPVGRAQGAVQALELQNSLSP